MNSQSKKIIAGVLLATVAVLGVRKMRSMNPEVYQAGINASEEQLQEYQEQLQDYQDRLEPESGQFWREAALKKKIEEQKKEIAKRIRNKEDMEDLMRPGAPLAPTGSGRIGRFIAPAASFTLPYRKAIAKRASQLRGQFMRPVRAVGRGLETLGKGAYGYVPGMPQWAKDAWSKAGGGLNKIYDKFKDVLPAKETLSQAAGSVDKMLRLDKIPFEKWQELSPESRLAITAGVAAALAGAGYAAYRYTRGRGAMSAQAQELTQLQEQVTNKILQEVTAVKKNVTRQRKFEYTDTVPSENAGLRIIYTVAHTLNNKFNGLTHQVLEELRNVGKQNSVKDTSFVYRADYIWGEDIIYTVWGIIRNDNSIVEAHNSDASTDTNLDLAGFDYIGLLGDLSERPAMQEEEEEAPAPSRAWYNPRRYVG